MQQYGDVVLKANPSGVATMGKKAEVTVYLAGTRNRASLFVDNGGAVLGNPFTANDDGSFRFCAADGSYDLYVGGVFIKTVTLFDPTAPTAASSVEFQAAGTGAQVRSVQDKLRELLSAADYDTFAHYLAARPVGFWSDTGGVVHRLPRVFAGAATANDGTLGNAAGKDWLESERDATTNNAQAAVLSAIGQGGVLGASRSSDFSGAGSMGCIGIIGYAINNNAAQVQTAYAGYFEARRKPGAGTTQGIEIDVANQDSLVSAYPAAMEPTGITPGLWLASGAGVVGAQTATLALGIINNGAAWEKGIVFQANSIAGCDGSTGTGIAIAFAKGHQQIWFNSTNAPVAEIRADASAAASAQVLLFSDFGLQILNRNDGGTLLNVPQLASAQAWLQVNAAATGGTPSVLAQGSAADVDLGVGGKGLGVINLLNPSVVGTAGAQVGFVKIKVNGTALMVPIYNP